MQRGLCPHLRWVDGAVPSVDDVLVKRVLHVRGGVDRPEHALVVGLVVGEERRRLRPAGPLALQAERAERYMSGNESGMAVARDLWLGPVTLSGPPPGPCVA